MMLDINITVEDGAIVPQYQTLASSGMDVHAFVPVETKLYVGNRVVVPTGIRMEIPAGFEIQVRPRSGLAVKHGITVLNTPGTIDEDYRGEIQIVLINHGTKTFIINPGDRIAQLVLCPTTQANLHVVDKLSDTERGSGGMGHTGL